MGELTFVQKFIDLFGLEEISGAYSNLRLETFDFGRKIGVVASLPDKRRIGAEASFEPGWDRALMNGLIQSAATTSKDRPC